MSALTLDIFIYMYIVYMYIYIYMRLKTRIIFISFGAGLYQLRVYLYPASSDLQLKDGRCSREKLRNRHWVGRGEHSINQIFEHNLVLSVSTELLKKI